MMDESLHASAERIIRAHLKFIFTKPDRMGYEKFDNSELIALIDPDLSFTTNEAKPYLSNPLYNLKEELLGFVISAGQQLVISQMTFSDNAPVEQSVTENHVRALTNIASLVSSVGSNELKWKTENKMLTLFAFAAGGRRPDLTAHPKFPWKQAVYQAINKYSGFMEQNFTFRFGILQNAPRDLIAQSALEHARDNPYTILDILDNEFTLIGPKDYWLEQDLYEIIAAMPTGEKNLAQGTLLWAIRATARWLSREKEKSPSSREPIPEPYLNLLWDAARRQWQTLAETDRQTFLQPELLGWIDGVYRSANTDTVITESPLGQFDALVNKIAHAASPEAKNYLIEEYTRVIKEMPEFQVPSCVEKWFPEVAEAVEAKRPPPQTFFQKLTSGKLFRRI